MKVVSVSSDDWANFAYQFSESLKAVGVDSHSYCLNNHVFDYPKQSTKVSAEDLLWLTEDADFVVVHHSCYELLPYINPKNVIHYAAGSKYRQSHKLINEYFKHAKATFIALPEFQTLAKNPFYVVGAVDTESLKPSLITMCNGATFGHFPSNHEVKGTSTIVNLMREFPIPFITSNIKVSYSEQIDRMRLCDVYIELLSPTQGGKQYGSFGMTCLEAAALGKVVITQNLTGEKLYQDTYGEFVPLAVNDELHFKRMITSVIAHQNNLIEAQHDSREWVVKNHSYKATGERVKSILETL